MSILSEIRAFREAVEDVAQALRDSIGDTTVAAASIVAELQTLAELQRAHDAPEQRITELERSHAKWEAEMEALLLRADSTFKGAANAESRARTMMRHSEKLADPFDDPSAPDAETVRESHAPRGEAEGVPPVRVAVALDHKAQALRYKFS